MGRRILLVLGLVAVYVGWRIYTHEPPDQAAAEQAIRDCRIAATNASSIADTQALMGRCDRLKAAYREKWGDP